MRAHSASPILAPIELPSGESRLPSIDTRSLDFSGRAARAKARRKTCSFDCSMGFRVRLRCGEEPRRMGSHLLQTDRRLVRRWREPPSDRGVLPADTRTVPGGCHPDILADARILVSCSAYVVLGLSRDRMSRWCTRPCRCCAPVRTAATTGVAAPDSYVDALAGTPSIHAASATFWTQHLTSEGIF